MLIALLNLYETLLINLLLTPIFLNFYFRYFILKSHKSINYTDVIYPPQKFDEPDSLCMSAKDKRCTTKETEFN